jgi:hypothetical protein
MASSAGSIRILVVADEKNLVKGNNLKKQYFWSIPTNILAFLLF